MHAGDDIDACYWSDGRTDHRAYRSSMPSVEWPSPLRGQPRVPRRTAAADIIPVIETLKMRLTGTRPISLLRRRRLGKRHARTPFYRSTRWLKSFAHLLGAPSLGSLCGAQSAASQSWPTLGSYLDSDGFSITVTPAKAGGRACRGKP
jgi:hypothetical protein